MVRYTNPGGINYGSQNLDGYGISLIVVAVTYSLFFYAACVFLWLYRHHPMVQKRNVPLLLMSLLTLHCFNFIIMIRYPLNGAFPCQVEFWVMNLYLPIGIGLFQAQNQQLLIVSQEQAQLLVSEEPFRCLPPERRGVGSLGYWLYRFRIWWGRVNKARQYQAYVFVGIIVQFTVSMIVYNISRKFNHYGVVSQHVGPDMCRRGWEWAPSIIWQFLWNWFFGPYLIWKIRMIRDIYQWRLQTILAVVAGLPGTPIWLATVYTDKVGAMNKYWFPGLWFAPGLTTMEIVTLGFPIYQIFKYKRAARETHRALDAFDRKQLLYSDKSTNMSSLHTGDTTHSSLPYSVKRGGMYSMETLDECLSSNHDGLQIYASCMELNGENIKFLTRVLVFRETCSKAFQSSCKTTANFGRARAAMFRVALSIFVSLIHVRTARYPINIESVIYARLDSIFGAATTLIASERYSRGASIATGTSSSVTPWDEPQGQLEETGNESYPMHTIGGDTAPRPPQSTFTRASSGNDSRERIFQVTHVVNDDGSIDPDVFGGSDPLEGVKVPADFDEKVFDAAFKSVRYMVWTETWQRYLNWKSKLGGPEPRVNVQEV